MIYINRTASVLCHFVVAVVLAFGAVFLIGTFTHILYW